MIRCTINSFNAFESHFEVKLCKCIEEFVEGRIGGREGDHECLEVNNRAACNCEVTCN